MILKRRKVLFGTSTLVALLAAVAIAQPPDEPREPLERRDSRRNDGVLDYQIRRAGRPLGNQYVTPSSATIVKRPAQSPAGPKRDLTYHLVWLIESDDANRPAYEGPARGGLDERGFGRLIAAGDASTTVSVGSPVDLLCRGRYGKMSVNLTLLNSYDADQVQINAMVQFGQPAGREPPLKIHTVTRLPIDRWVLLGSTTSMVGSPRFAIDGKRSVLILRLGEGIPLLD